jgi:zinc protease
MAALLSASSSAGPLDALRASNASVRRTVLDNGMVCLVKEDPSAPVVAVQIWVGSGAVHEQEFLGAGLSHYMEHMIFKGTPTRGPAEVTKAIDDAGGEINAYTAQDRTVFHADLPSRNWRVGVDVLADAVMHASLPEAEWEREKQVILREFAMGYDSPERVLNKLIWDTAFRVHPYRVPVIGYEDVFRTMTRDQLETYFHRHYVPDNMITVVVGDIDADEVQAYLRQVFAGFARRPRAPITLPAEPPQMAPRTARQTGTYEVTRLVHAWHTVPLNHPDAPALDLLAAIVGQGRSSRLERRLKEQQRLVLEIDAWSYTPKEAGLFGISATVEPDQEAAARAAIEREVGAWLEEPFTAEELEKARRGMLVSELGGLQTASGQASSYASGEFYAGNPRFAEFYLAGIESVTAEQLRDVAARYLRPANRTEVVLAPDEAPAAAAREATRHELNLQRIVLSNGVPLIVRPDHRLPFLHVTAALTGGVLSENPTNNGITQLMADLLTRGTARRSAEQLAEEIERLGASLSGFAGRNSFGLQASGLSGDADVLLEVLADCLTHSTFPDVEVDKQRAIQLAGIRQQREQPMFVGQEALRETLFPNHPYRFNPSGTEASVGGLTRADLQAHFQRYVNASNLALAICGDITLEQARALAERHFSAVPAGARPAMHLEAAAPDLPARREQREPREQAIVLVGFPGLDVKDPRVDALSILQKAMSGLSSDLGIEVREKRGLVYYVGAFSLVALDPGFFAFYAGTRPDAVPEVERLIDEQIERLVREGLREEEFNRAREQILAAQDMSLQSNGEIAQLCALNELYGLGYRYQFELPERMARLTPADVQKAAASVLEAKRKAVALVLPETPTPTEETP